MNFFKWCWINAYDIVPLAAGIICMFLIGAGVLVDYCL
jgi:hypothetical protein